MPEPPVPVNNWVPAALKVLDTGVTVIVFAMTVTLAVAVSPSASSTVIVATPKVTPAVNKPVFTSIFPMAVAELDQKTGSVAPVTVNWRVLVLPT